MKEENYNLLTFNSYEEISQNDRSSLILFPNLESIDAKYGLNPENINCFNEKDNTYNNNLNNSIKLEEDLKRFYRLLDKLDDEKKENNNINIINNDKKENIFINENNFSKFKNNNLDANFFPFTPGKRKNNAVNSKLSEESNSFIQIDEMKDNVIDSEKSLKENSTNFEQIINNTKNIHDLQFMTKKYHITPDGKKRKIKKIRKFKSDNIRKKIKSRFHKTLKDLINEGLKIAGSKKLFDFIPHFFVNNVTRKINSKFFDLTFEELLSYNFINEEYNEKGLNKEADYKKFLKNQEVLKYLEKNENICKESGFDLIRDKKYKDILKAYFSSLEFENSIIRLKKENENNDYIQEYIFIARHYVEFFSNDNYDENEEIKNNENINI